MKTDMVPMYIIFKQGKINNYIELLYKKACVFVLLFDSVDIKYEECENFAKVT